MMHILTFDIEDWFHIMEIDELENREAWDRFPSIVEEKTGLILDILDDYDAKATFFVLGWIAKKYPKIAPRIVKRGHELATHGYWHRRVYEQTPESFYNDLKDSVELLQEQTGIKISGYRAPSFSIIPGMEWAFEILCELGIEYDSSLFPAKRGHGGYPCSPRPNSIRLQNGKTITELPISIVNNGKLKLPFSGGGYLRLLPSSIIRWGFDQFESQNLPVITYLHPRDFAPEQPRVSMPLNRKFKSYIGLSTTEKKLRMLLNNYRFTTCSEYVCNNLII